MLDFQEINDEIARLEEQETTYPNCSKLAVLYSISEHHQNKPQQEPRRLDGYSFGASEFLTIASRAPANDVLEVLDEHLEVIKLLHPKEYSAVIRKIKERASI